MKKILTIFLLLMPLSLFAATGAFFVGINGDAKVFHVIKRMRFDTSKVTSLPADQRFSGNSRQFDMDFNIGARSWNSWFYSEADLFVSPLKHKLNSTDGNISATVKRQLAYGGRLQLGVRQKLWVIYGILGVGITKMNANNEFGIVGSIYNRPPAGSPGPSLAATSARRNRTWITTFGIGVNRVVDKNWVLELDYLHENMSPVQANLNETIMTVIGNPVGTARTELTSDAAVFGIKYMFNPFKI